MKKAKRSTFTVVALVLSLMLVISACSGNGGNEGGSNNPTNAPTSSTEPTDSGNEGTGQEQLEEHTLKLVYTGATQKDEEKVEAAINEYLKDKINAKLDLIAIDWGPWEEKLNLMIAGRDEVDIIFTAVWQKHAINVKKGAFIDVGPLLQSHGQGILDSLDPLYLEGAKVGGVNYAVPTNKEFAAQGGIVYRKDIAEELGLDMSKVKTIYDLEEIFATIKEKKPGMTPLYLTRGETFNSHYFVGIDALGDTSVPGMILKDLSDTKVHASYEDERYLEHLRVTRDYFQKGYVNRDAATSLTGTADALKTGNVFAVVASLKPGKAKEMENQISYQGKLEQLELTPKTTSTSEAAGSMLAISSTSKDPERAMMFINLLHTDEVLNNLLNFGIEGTHYEKVSDKIIKPGPEAGNYSTGAQWMFGNQFLNYVTESEDPDKWEKFRQFNENPKLSPGFGFFFDHEPVTAEVGVISNLEREYLPTLETGSVDIDKVLPEFAQKMKAAGADRIIELKQQAFDEFLASK